MATRNPSAVPTSISPPLLRRLRLAAALSVALAAPLLTARGASAQSAPPAADGTPPVNAANAVQPRMGKATVNALVYSSTGTKGYPTMRLKEGAQVTVVGYKGEWLTILPPEGSFCYVPRAFVNVNGAGRGEGKGVVTKEVLAKAGSSMNPSKYTPQAKLSPNDTVTVVGDDGDEYLKIKPPEGAYLYVKKDEVAPMEPLVRRPDGVLTPPAPQPPAPTVASGGRETEPPAVGPSVTVTPGPGDVAAAPPPAVPAAPPSTQPGTAALLQQLQKLEADFADMSKKPLLEQPVGDLLAQYEQLATNPSLPDVARRIVDVRTTTLKVRNEAREQFQAVQKQQQEFQERQKVAGVEGDEIKQRIKEIDIQVYAAVGTLRTSSLQVAKTPLYRLTDPQTGRTVVYVWGTDPKVPDLIGQFVGVKGPMQTDGRLNLKVVTPTAVESVDQAKVNGSVAAEIVPPSLMPRPGTGTASTAGQ